MIQADHPEIPGGIGLWKTGHRRKNRQHLWNGAR